MFSAFSIALFFVIKGSIEKKGKWGINTDSIVQCPRCSAVLPKFRKPISLNQALWGGGVCKICGCEVDKWGEEIKK